MSAGVAGDRLTPSQAWRVYVSHFLSMWNSRTYEYGAILFIQAAFPGDLLPSSINGIAETVCVLVSAGALGRWVDKAPSRLRPLLLTIVVNRVTLVVCCLLWVLLFLVPQAALRLILFALILGLGMVEKASRMANTLSMERDWIPTLANDHSLGSSPSYDLTHLNTVIRRIDIACKFFAPLAISSVVALLEPTLTAMAVGGMGAMSMALELWTAMIVWRLSPRLQLAKSDTIHQLQPTDAPKASSSLSASLRFVLMRLEELVLTQIDGLKYYFSTQIWLPSLGIAVLHASVLAWSGTLITWLLNAGLSLPGVTVAKGVGSVFEISSTLIFPWAVEFFKRRDGNDTNSSPAYQLLNRGDLDGEEPEDHRPEDDDPPVVDVAPEDHPLAQELGTPSLHRAVVQVAFWAIIELAIILVPTVFSLFYLDRSFADGSSDAPTSSDTKGRGTSFAAVAFFALLSISFLGRWTYDLAITQLTLMLVPESHRSSFGGTEMALVSTVSLVHWTASAIWHAQDDFRWLSFGSMCAVIGAAVAYARWTRRWLAGSRRLVRAGT